MKTNGNGQSSPGVLTRQLVSLRLREGRAFYGFKEAIRDEIRDLEFLLIQKRGQK